MTDHRDRPAQPEQPGNGGFEEGHQTLPDDEPRRTIQRRERDASRRRPGREVQRRRETLPPGEHEGRFSDTVDADR